MVVLALDTTTPAGSCALVVNGVVECEEASDVSLPPATRLPLDLMSILEHSRVGLRRYAYDGGEAMTSQLSGPGGHSLGEEIGVAGCAASERLSEPIADGRVRTSRAQRPHRWNPTMVDSTTA